METLKNKIQYLFLIMAAVTLFSCSSDDDENETNVDNIQITPTGYAWAGMEGSYAGWTSASFAYSPDPMVADGEKIDITVNEDGTADITLTSSQWGTMTIPSAAVKEENGAFALSGEGTAVLGMAGKEPKEYACIMAGTFAGDFKSCTVVFTLPAVMGGLNITFSNGNAPTAE
ncbi:MAG: calycin-like domain-containing protein [Prevotella sp.]|nr:calycin-like domain-containing protein [Prevotella sp.]